MISYLSPPFTLLKLDKMSDSKFSLVLEANMTGTNFSNRLRRKLSGSVHACVFGEGSKMPSRFASLRSFEETPEWLK